MLLSCGKRNDVFFRRGDGTGLLAGEGGLNQTTVLVVEGSDRAPVSGVEGHEGEHIIVVGEAAGEERPLLAGLQVDRDGVKFSVRSEGNERVANFQYAPGVVEVSHGEIGDGDGFQRFLRRNLNLFGAAANQKGGGQQTSVCDCLHGVILLSESYLL